MHDSKIRSRLKAQLTKFSLELCEGLTKPLAGFVSQMLFGIQSSQDVKLSNIARSLQEEKHLRNLTCKRVQCDEIWAFVYAKLQRESARWANSQRPTLTVPSPRTRRFRPSTRLSSSVGRGASAATTSLMSPASRMPGTTASAGM